MMDGRADIADDQRRLALRFEEERQVSAGVTSGHHGLKAGHDSGIAGNEFDPRGGGERVEVFARIGAFQFGKTAGGVLPFAAADDMARLRKGELDLLCLVEPRSAAGMIEVQMAEYHRVDFSRGDSQTVETAAQGLTTPHRRFVEIPFERGILAAVAGIDENSMSPVARQDAIVADADAVEPRLGGVIFSQSRRGTIPYTTPPSRQKSPPSTVSNCQLPRFTTYQFTGCKLRGEDRGRSCRPTSAAGHPSE